MRWWLLAPACWPEHAARSMPCSAVSADLCFGPDRRCETSRCLIPVFCKWKMLNSVKISECFSLIFSFLLMSFNEKAIYHLLGALCGRWLWGLLIYASFQDKEGKPTLRHGSSYHCFYSIWQSNCQGQNPAWDSPWTVFSLLELEPCQKSAQQYLYLTLLLL